MNLSDSDIARFWSKVRRDGDHCWEWQGSVSVYGAFSVGPRGNSRTLLPHRVAFYLANGYLPEVVCHKCDNKICVNPSHLMAGTQLINRRDCQAKQRTARGESHGKSVLTEAIVRRIIKLEQAGLSVSQIAAKLGQANTTVRNVITGHTWSWLTGRKTR